MDYRSPTPWLLGGVLVLAGVGAVHALTGAAARCKPTVAAGDRILLIGDSLAVGLATPLREVASASKCEFQALAKSGTRIDQWLGGRRADLESTLRTYAPTVILVSLGTNDSASNYSGETLAQNVSQLAALLTPVGKLMWIKPPRLPFPDRVGPEVSAQGIPAFDSAALPIPQVDGIHPTGKGYAGWAEHLWASMTCSVAPAEALSGVVAPSNPPVPTFMRPAKVARPAGTAAASLKRASRKKAWRV